MSEYRSHRDESMFTPAQCLAWEYVMPWRYIPILETDRDRADELALWLSKHFTPRALSAAANGLKVAKITRKPKS